VGLFEGKIIGLMLWLGRRLIVKEHGVVVGAIDFG